MDSMTATIKENGCWRSQNNAACQNTRPNLLNFQPTSHILQVPEGEIVFSCSWRPYCPVFVLNMEQILIRQDPRYLFLCLWLLPSLKEEIISMSCSLQGVQQLSINKAILKPFLAMFLNLRCQISLWWWSFSTYFSML